LPQPDANAFAARPSPAVAGCKRKFDIDQYVARVGALVRDIKAGQGAKK
jgi:hypothetical protein